MLSINFPNTKRLFLLITILLQNAILAYSQGGKVIITDSKSKESIPFAHVCFEELGTKQKLYHVTDKDGVVINPCKKGSIIAISFVGYKTYIDTLQPNISYNIALVPQVFDIDQVVVTASYTPQKADKSIYNVKVIDSRTIEQKSATNLSDVLKDEVNIQVTNDPALGSSLKLKGLSGNNVKILIDGVPVIGRMGGNIDLSQLSLYNIDHVEVVEGPMSVVYGSNALAGAINIVTKENLHSNYTATFNTYYENVGKYNVNGSASIRKGKNSFSLSGGWNFFNGISLDIDQNRSQRWKPKEQYNADAYYTFSDDRSKIKVQTSLMYERLLDKGDQLSPSFRTARDSWFYSVRTTNRVEYSNKLKNSYFLNIMASQSFYQRKKLTYNKDFIDNTSILVNDASSNDTSKFDALTFRATFGNLNSEQRLSFNSGLDINYENGKGKRILDNKQEIGDYALFTSVMYNLNKNLSLQPGLRYAINTKFDVPLVPSVNVKWNAASFLNIRASYTRGYRAPTIKELYILFKDSSHDIQPSSDLKAEYGHNYALSFNINTDKADKIHFSNIELEFFYNQMHNKIDLAVVETVNNNGIYKYINISNNNTLGGRLTFKYSFYSHFDLGVGLGETGTFASFSKVTETLNKYKYSPEGTVNLTITIPKVDIKLITNYKYFGENWQFNIDENNVISYGYMDKYQNLDVSLLKKFLSNRMTATIGLKNVFDNTIIKNTGRSSDAPHSSAEGSNVGYGRVFFTSITYNIFQ